MRVSWVGTILVGTVLFVSLAAVPAAEAQDFVLTALVLVNAQNAVGYSTNPQAPGEFQRFTERYLEHLQTPYQVVDVATQAPPADLSRRQLIISAHRGLNPGATWQTAITNAVAGGVGFVNLDSDATVGQQAHIKSIFGASGSSVGTPGTAIRIPQAVVSGGSAPHFIAALQRRFWNDPPGDIVYGFHADATAVVRSVQSTVLTGASGTVIAWVGTDPLIRATSSGQGRAVHFGTLDYLHADRFGFVMGMDDLFWRSLVWAARKPFVVRGYPRLWAVQMDDTLSGWGARVRDLYDVALTGPVAADGTGGPWRVTGNVFTNNVAPGSADRASVIADISAGRLQVSPHARGPSFGDIYWETQAAQPLNDTTWFQTVNDVLAWVQGNGGADTIPFLSRSMVPHFWNLANITGADLWNTLRFRYITEIQRPGIDFYSKTDADRPRLRPVRLYELPPYNNPDENYPIYQADNYTVSSRAGLAPQTFFAFTTQVIDLTRYDRQDVAWPNNTRPVEQTIDQFQYYTWRLWSSLAPVQIYTHDGSNNYVLSTVAQRQQVTRDVSAWLNAQGVRHVFMQDLGDYMAARTRSVLTGAQVTGGTLTLTFSGNATTADGRPISTEVLLFQGDTEGAPQTVAGFAGGATVTVALSSSNPMPTTTGLSPASAVAGGAGFTLTVTGTDFLPSSVARWNGAARATTFVSATQLTAAIPAADITIAGTAAVTVFTPTPGGGTSNSQTFTITSSASGLVAAYSFDEGSGATVTDASGNGNTGTISGATWTAFGRFGGALLFNGTNAWVTVNDSASLDLSTGMTLEAWVYPTVSPTAWRTVIAKEGSGTVEAYFLHASSSPNNQPATGLTIGGTQQALVGGTTVPVNTWTHLAATYDGAVQRLYVNGVQVASRAQTGAIITTANPLRVGGNSIWGEYFQGRIDEVRIYNRALSPGDIQTDMSTSISPVTNPVPTTTGLSPTAAAAGGPAFTLTVNGSNFISGSTVRWNGSARTTTFVSAAQVTAAIPASDIAAAGTASVTVFNPAPGGGTSNVLTFTISGSVRTTVTFDNPIPPGTSGSFLNGVFEGLDFGTSQWSWENAFGADTTRHIYFASSTGTSRTFTFSPGPRTLVSMRVFTGAGGTLTLTDNLGQSWTQAITTGSMQPVTTGWTQPSTTVTVAFTAGWQLGVDDIVYTNP